MSDNLGKELGNHISDYKEMRKEFEGHLVDSKELEMNLKNYHKRLNEIEDLKLPIKITEFTDGMKNLVDDIGKLNKSIWIVAAVGGLCGGLTSQLIPEAITFLIKKIFNSFM